MRLGSPNAQYTWQIKAIIAVNMLLDAPGTDADIWGLSFML
jgi:hypothetical protein